MTLFGFATDYDGIFNSNAQYLAPELTAAAGHAGGRAVLPPAARSLRLLPRALQNLQPAILRTHGSAGRRHFAPLRSIHADPHQVRHRRQQGTLACSQTESSTRMAVFVLLTMVGLVFGIYYIFLQYFVLLVEVIMFALLIVLEGLELILGFFACWQFQTY